MSRKGGEAVGHESGLVRLAPDVGGLKKSIGGLESDVVGHAADVRLSAAASFQFADDGVRLEEIRGGQKNAGGGLKKMSVESDDARFRSAESGVRVDDSGRGLGNVGVETADAEFQSADVGVGLKHIGGRHENIGGGLEKLGGGLKKLGGGLKNIGVETTDAGFQSAAARFQTSASLFRLSDSSLLFETAVLSINISASTSSSRSPTAS
jgi:hypothetical protein